MLGNTKYHPCSDRLKEEFTSTFGGSGFSSIDNRQGKVEKAFEKPANEYEVVHHLLTIIGSGCENHRCADHLTELEPQYSRLE
jgi:hypothetical protein